MDKEPTIDLPWEGPFSFCGLLTDKNATERFSKKPGVYLWVTEQPSGKIITYVGKASGRPDLIGRHLEHYRFYISGAYLIPQWALKSYIRWDADIFKNDYVRNTLFDREKLCGFVGEAFDYTSRISIFLAITSGHEANLSLIEHNLIYYDVKPEENVQGTKRPPSKRIYFNHVGATGWLQYSTKNSR